jgi:uncharacterized membrane protein
MIKARKTSPATADTRTQPTGVDVDGCSSVRTGSTRGDVATAIDRSSPMGRAQEGAPEDRTLTSKDLPAFGRVLGPMVGTAPGPVSASGETARMAGADHKRLDRAFRVVLWLKGLDGALELIGGVVLLFVTPASLNHLVWSLTVHELAHDPNDFVARHLLHSASRLSRSKTLYGAVYLLGHGVSKVVLVVALLRDRLWAYPWMIGLLVVFIAYQLYRLAEQPTWGLIVLTAFDVLVVVLTVREYQQRRTAVA